MFALMKLKYIRGSFKEFRKDANEYVPDSGISKLDPNSLNEKD